MSNRQELSLEQIQEKVINKILDIRENSEDGAVILFKDGDSVSASVINLSNADLMNILHSLAKQTEVE